MRDQVLNAFLIQQEKEGRALARQSDLLDLRILDGPPARRYVARFGCRGLVRSDSGEVGVAEHFEVGIVFRSNYLREANPMEVLGFFGPRNAFHPNIGCAVPLICIGPIVPGTRLVDLLYRAYEVITYQRYMPREDDALNPAACAWARHHRERFPVDRRPLLWKRRSLDVSIEEPKQDEGER